MKLDLYLNVDEIIQYFNKDKDCLIRVYSYNDIDVVPSTAVDSGYNIIYTIELYSNDYKEVGDYDVYISWLRDCFESEFLVIHSNNGITENEYIVKIHLL